ncbi:EamA family transporter [uncultured Methylobacterium sp.]|uniref:DMT family transporter n=1 Tax=uncultured Methylobacterium sp. TaxID=157278 RepID=UPI0026243BF9|nr:EamA family transporter [uncultured Methylobacterium sp.]
MTAVYYVLTVLIWGTTWIAIKGQLGPVAFEASIAYRFAIAGAVLFAALALTRRLQPIPWRQQPYVVLQALCLFSCNFVCFYLATRTIASGILSVVFSAATIFNIANAYLFHRRRPSARLVAGAVIGLAGILLLFRDAVAGAALGGDTVLGLGLAVLGTWFFSAGNLVSARNQRHGLTVGTVNAYGMLYGAALVAAVSLALGVPFGFDPSPVYVGSLLYLAIPGSVIAFTSYLTVVHRLGPEKAAYMTVLFPVVALAISIAVEGYRVTPLAALGFAAVLAGNVVVFAPRGLFARNAKGRPEAAS